MVFLALLAAILVGVYLLWHPPVPDVPNGGMLVVAPVGDLAEQAGGVRRQLESAVSGQASPTVVRDVIRALDRARSDARIQGVLLKLDHLGQAEPGQVQDVVAAIDRFRQSGKKIVAWSDDYDQTRYELASHADRIDLDPMGAVLLTGYGVYRQYYKDALDKLGVTINVFRVGTYKSFVEPFTRNDMSGAARTDNRRWLDSLWSTYHDVVTADRAIDSADIDRYVSGYASRLSTNGGDGATLARKAGLVDALTTFGQLRRTLIGVYGRNADTGSFRQIDVGDYLAATEPDTGDIRRLAVVTVSGDIVDGESTPGAAGGQTIARLIDAARRDPQLAGLVLRINSPGGSVTGAEHIRRAVAAFRGAGKPVVVSMAGVAASGGYWIAMDANEIWAEPSTITGSIGIFAIVPTFDKPLGKLGIHVDGVGTTPLAGALRLDQPLSAPVKTMLQARIERGYREFVGRVAKARHMTPAAVERVAQGRVWSGAGAKSIGLVDRLGDVTRAESAAARLAGLDPANYRLQPMTSPSDWRSALRQLLTARLGVAWLGGWPARIMGPPMQALAETLRNPQALYARCFCRLAGRSTGAGTAAARQALIQADALRN